MYFILLSSNHSFKSQEMKMEGCCLNKIKTNKCPNNIIIGSTKRFQFHDWLSFQLGKFQSFWLQWNSSCSIGFFTQVPNSAFEKALNNSALAFWNSLEALLASEYWVRFTKFFSNLHWSTKDDGSESGQANIKAERFCQDIVHFLN